MMFNLGFDETFYFPENSGKFKLWKMKLQIIPKLSQQNNCVKYTFKIFNMHIPTK